MTGEKYADKSAIYYDKSSVLRIHNERISLYFLSKIKKILHISRSLLFGII